MPFSISGARLDLYKVGTATSDGPDHSIPQEDIDIVEIERKIKDQKDTGSITLINHDGKYSTGDVEINSGDRLDFYVDSTGGQELYGSFGYGRKGYGHSAAFRWSAIARAPEYERLGPNRSLLSFDIEDLAFGILSMRNAYNVFEDAAVAGSDSAILNTVIGNECPELSTAGLEDVGHRTSYTADGTNILELAGDMADRANALLYAEKDKVVMKNKKQANDMGDLDPDDIGTFGAGRRETDIANSVRVDGGSDYELDDEQAVQNGYSTVTESQRLTFRISTRKAALDRIELWTNPSGTNSDEAVTVRLQKDDGGSPVSVGDESSDLVSKTLSHEFLSDDGFTTFLLGSHDLPEPRPWCIVESDGSGGQEIGVDTTQSSASGDPLATYRAHYEYPVTVRLGDQSSQRKYRRRDKRIKEENVVSLNEARDIANEKLNHDATPNPDLTAPALTENARDLRLGDVVTMPPEFERERVSGDYLVVEVSDTYTNSKLNVTLKFVEIGSV